MLVIFIVTASTLVSSLDIHYFGVVDCRNEVVLLLADSEFLKKVCGDILGLEKFPYV